jgi:hypothetical protein
LYPRLNGFALQDSRSHFVTEKQVTVALFAAQEAATEAPGVYTVSTGAAKPVSTRRMIRMTSAEGSRPSAYKFRRESAIWPVRRRCTWLRALSWTCALFGVASLAGCSFSDGVGPYIVDPGRYSVYHCKDLVERLKALTTREKDLRALMDKASEGGGGSLIGTLSYRPDYEKELGDEKVLRRTAAEKKCALEPPAFESDQSIR